MRILTWLIRAFIFFTLFAFALNNQHEASLHLFFGQQWRSPMVLIVLAAFAVGLVVGVLGMAPRRWRRSDIQRVPTSSPVAPGKTDTINHPGAPHGL